jgi:hypothetical protein
MEFTNEIIKGNLQKILDLEVMYRLTGTTHIYKELAEILNVSDRMIHYHHRKNTLKDKLELLFDAAKNYKGTQIELDELKKLVESNKSKTKRGIGFRPLTVAEIKDAQTKSRSAAEAAKLLGVSYNTYKKYAREHNVFEDLKNPYGYGIKKGNPANANKKPKNISDEAWQNRLKVRELKKRHLHKYHTKSGDVEYGCALYFITIPKGESRKEYIQKWGTLPIKIGISKDVVKRYSDLVLKKRYVESDEPKWIEWNQRAEVINMIPFYTWEECIKVESRIHKYIREYRIEGIKSKGGGEAEEMFEADFDIIKEAIETYVTGWRLLKWNEDEMTNYYGECFNEPFTIRVYNRNDNI